ncbi:MAG TPA: 5'-methylthioadenosine/adenosylhomocysteine nucleosidase [Burkholderiaceae bacterium]
MSSSTIAVVSAMHEELHALLPWVEGAQPVALGGRIFHVGRLHGQPVVLVLSGIGKVSAATTAALLIDRFESAALLFTGVAGGLQADVAVGDVVVARSLLQHDMDASPLFPRYEVPMTGRSRFQADAVLADALADAARLCLEREAGAHAALPWWPTRRPARVHEGLIVSGDRFVASAAQSAQLRAELPDALAVEMEGAAVAQVCADFGRPFAVLRAISDRADDTAHVDFGRFIAEVASVYTRGIVGDWFARRIVGP